MHVPDSKKEKKKAQQLFTFLRILKLYLNYFLTVSGLSNLASLLYPSKAVGDVFSCVS